MIVDESIRDSQNRQRLREGESLSMGMKAYRKTLATRGDAEMPTGLRLVSEVVEPLSKAIDKYVEEHLSGKGKQRGNQTVKYLSQFESDHVAFLTARACIESMAGNKTVQTVAMTLARRLNDALDYNNLKEQDPQAWQRYIKRVREHPTLSDDHRTVIVKRQMAWAGVSTIRWRDSERIKLGTLLVILMCEVTGLTAIECRVVGNKKSSCKLLVPTAATREWLAQSHSRCELLQPYNMPMVCVPKDWDSAYGGGYLCTSSNYSLIKTADKSYLAAISNHEMPVVYGAVNSLQRTAWQVNEPIFLLMTKAWELGGKIGGLPDAEKAPLPPKLHDPKDAEAVKLWKRQAYLAHTAEHKSVSARMQLSSKLWVAEKYLKEDAFYFPYAMDWRGRLYPVSASLNPQGDDAAKALLRFSKGVRLGTNGAYELAVHGANCYGVDKVRNDARAQWVYDHRDGILESAVNPMNTEWWQKADSPYQFLAFCLEWSRLLMHSATNGQEDFMSHLPVAFDGTCNGLQNFSAMLRDEVGGMSVGLVPTDEPQDVYTDILNKVEELVANEDSPMATKWAGNVTRGLVKQNAMTMPYGVTKWGMKDQILAAFVKISESGSPLPFEVGTRDALYLADKNYEAIGKTVIAARKIMDWLRSAATVAASDGLPISWTTPAGLPVLQSCVAWKHDRASFDVAGKRVRLMLRNESGTLDRAAQATGIAPNFVHSLDASHLMLTVNYCVARGVTNFAMIHDSYATHAGNASILSYELRRAFKDQYQADVLGDLRESILGKLDDASKKLIAPLPERGKLDLDGVMDSEYFFA